MNLTRRLLSALLAALCCTVSLANEAATSGKVLVAGATGRSGRLIVEELRTQGYAVRAFVRDADDARELFGNDVEIVTGDVTDPASIVPAMGGISAVISAVGAGGTSGRSSPEKVDYEGVRNLAQAAADAGVGQFVLISSMGTTHDDHPLNRMFGNVLLWKARGEQAVRDSGVAYTIVRPGGLINEAAGQGRVTAMQGDPRMDSTVLPRADLARVCVAAIREPAARDKTFEVIRRDGEPVSDWQAFFAALEPDGG